MMAAVEMQPESEVGLQKGSDTTVDRGVSRLSSHFLASLRRLSDARSLGPFGRD
jgi:hypothetical protein